MTSEPNLSLKRAKHTGTWICLGAVVAGGVFLVGLLQGAYWALAIPVALGVLGALNLAFWIGYTINTVDTIPPDAEQYRDPGSRRAALAICAGSAALAVAFLAGIFSGSYLALAIPVALAVLGLLAMVFWIGWSIHTARTTLPDSEDDDHAPEAAGGAGS